MSGYEHPAYGQPAATSGKAIAALVCGILGFVVLPVIFSIAAIVLGRGAQREIAAEPHRLSGGGLAKAGVILGWIGLALVALAILVVVVLVVLAA